MKIYGIMSYKSGLGWCLGFSLLSKIGRIFYLIKKRWSFSGASVTPLRFCKRRILIFHDFLDMLCAPFALEIIESFSWPINLTESHPRR